MMHGQNHIKSIKAVNVVIGINGVNYVTRAAPVHSVATGAPAVSGPLWLSNLNIPNCSTWMYEYMYV